MRRRIQPNSRPSGSTSTMCAGSKWAAAKASELTMKPGHRAPAAGDPAVEQAAEHQLLDDRREHRQQQQAETICFGTNSITCFMPCGSMPSWLTATDRASVARAPNTEVFPVGRPQPERRKGRPAERRHGHDHRQKADQRRRRRGSVSISRLGKNRTTTKPITGRASRENAAATSPERAYKSFWIKGLASDSKPFDSSAGRPYTPAAQSVVPILGSPVRGAPLIREGSRIGAISVWANGVAEPRCSKV